MMVILFARIPLIEILNKISSIICTAFIPDLGNDSRHTRYRMLVGRPTGLRLFPGTYLQIYAFIFNGESPAYEHPMLCAVPYYITQPSELIASDLHANLLILSNLNFLL